MDKVTKGQLKVFKEANSPSYVVGIGASAGGLESLEKLFRNLPTDTGMAFVVLQHLSPDFKSMMLELLGRDTTMTIHRVEDGMPVEANSVYLLPPKKQMIIAGGQLHLSDKDPSKGVALPIDHFLESLARECGSKAIAIILSGSGSDGSRGIVDIAREDGFVISESLETAKFDGMPSSAQSTGLADEILAPEAIGALLHRLATQPEVSRRERIEQDTRKTDALRGMEAIFQLFRTAHDIDFSIYKDTTVLRRIHRRVAMVGATSVDEYACQILREPAEMDGLYGDLLIGVTQFFRDPQTFELLSQSVFPELVRAQGADKPIRAWVAGCATGEEAYSIAIAFHEAFDKVGKPFWLKLFATDVHKSSLEHAGRGVYGKNFLKGLTSERVDKYFELRDGSYQINQEIRKSIVFAPHNVLNDAPFTDLDFVSCRNMLIYFQPVAQRRSLSMFHYALNQGGILLLGGSESPGELSVEFETVHERERIYRKLRAVRLPNEFRSPLNRQSASSLHALSVRRQATTSGSGERQALQDQLLNRFMLPSLLIDENRALIDTFGGAEKLLRFPSRQPSLDVLDLVDKSLRTTLAGAIQRAFKDNTAVRFSNVQLISDDLAQSFNLTITPLTRPNCSGKHYVIAFEQLAPREPRPNSRPEQSAGRVVEASGELAASRIHIRQLEEDLRYSRENLQATIEELETSNEELQATNEELIASNEELQSTNEELHSVNEELYTVNAEHQRKIGELAELNQDMHHLLENTDVATVFLDRDLRVRRFTTRVTTLFDLVEHDIGRPIQSFLPKCKIDDLYGKLKEVLKNDQAFEQETHTLDGTCYLLRLLPYRTQGALNGVVLMLVDVSSLEFLRDRLRWMSAIVESTDDAIIGQDLQGRITSWNAGAERLYGYSAQEAIGQSTLMLIPSERRQEVDNYRMTIERGERQLATDTLRIHKDGRPIHVSLTVSPVRDSMNRTIGISKIARDISQRYRMEEEIRLQIRQREAFLATLSHELRNPLGAALNASRIVRDSRADQATRSEAAEIIERQISIARTLLVDLLDVSRIAQGKIDLKRTVLDLRDLVHLVRETTQSEIVRHQQELIFHLPEQPMWVSGDRTRLLQIQVNLIHNAAKYSPLGSRIEVRFERDEDCVLVSVADQGIGIPGDQLTRIFDPFVQIGESQNQSEGGLGVGLTLVRTLVELHGGRVSAASQGHDQGSTFRVWIPSVAVVPSVAKEIEALTIPAIAPPAALSCKIVLIEDIEDSRRMLQSLLELDGHTVFSAADGESGLQLIVHERPDVALVDIGLPGISGHDVARLVRETPESCHVRLIALTGYGRQTDIDQALASGFDSHLTKPVDPDQLTQELTRVGCTPVAQFSDDK
jgi:two-component system, chemotaxis family, CheB/CheR fusion protein